MALIACPRCQASIHLLDDIPLGSVIACPRCKNRLSVPVPPIDPDTPVGRWLEYSRLGTTPEISTPVANSPGGKGPEITTPTDATPEPSPPPAYSPLFAVPQINLPPLRSPPNWRSQPPINRRPFPFGYVVAFLLGMLAMGVLIAAISSSR